MEKYFNPVIPTREFMECYAEGIFPPMPNGEHVQWAEDYLQTGRVVTNSAGGSSDPTFIRNLKVASKAYLEDIKGGHTHAITR